ncbi:MAG: rod shape-determining protein MreD, partial [Parasporobacterium sp.]|nr:rod shape-determining protein MreD [Parasporobacterium sp.]
MFYRIRNFFIILLLVIAAALLQYTVIPRIPFLGVGPNIMLIIVVAFAYARGKNGGMLVGFMAGLFMDVFFCEVIG